MTDTTPTPAQADEKARERIKAAIRRGCADEINGKPCGDIIVKGCTAAEYVDPDDAAETFVDCIADEVLATIRPEGEAVAVGWIDESDLAVLARIKGQTGACRITAIKAHAGPGYQPVYASPPAPVGVKVPDSVQAALRFADRFDRLDSDTIGTSEICYGDLKVLVLAATAALLPPSPEAQAATPAEALPSQTSGAEAITARYTNWRGETAERTFIPHRVFFGSNEWHPEPQILIEATDCEKGALRTFAAAGFALTKPASEPAGGGVREALKAIAEGYAVDVHDDRYITVDNPRYQPDNGSAPKLVIDTAALSFPVSSPAEAEALPDGVEADEQTDRKEDLISLVNQRLIDLAHRYAGQTGKISERFFEAQRAVETVLRLNLPPMPTIRSALSPAPAQAGSQKDMSAHPRGSGQNASEVEP